MTVAWAVSAVKPRARQPWGRKSGVRRKLIARASVTKDSMASFHV